MSWYYCDQTEQLGPVDDVEFGKLLLAGKVTSETLVWKQGFAAWLPYGQVAQIIGNSGFDMEQTVRIVQPEEQELEPFVESVETVICEFSGQAIPKTQAVQVDGQWVDPQHQEALRLRVQQSPTKPTPPKKAGWWSSFLQLFSGKRTAK